MDEKPEMMKKIYPVWGEITSPNFALSDEHLKRVTETTQIMFHLAASLKLEATLKPNIQMNLTGTKYVLDVAKQMKNLIQMIHTSTAFCNIEHAVMEEKVYDSEHRPEDLIRCAEWMTEEAMAEAQKSILGLHPNTYTYTKRLAEILVRDEYDKGTLPVCIVRPSIVGPAAREPLPGWVDCEFKDGGHDSKNNPGLIRSAQWHARGLHCLRQGCVAHHDDEPRCELRSYSCGQRDQWINNDCQISRHTISKVRTGLGLGEIFEKKVSIFDYLISSLNENPFFVSQTERNSSVYHDAAHNATNHFWRFLQGRE